MEGSKLTLLDSGSSRRYRGRLSHRRSQSLAKTAICVISEHGKIVKETQVASEPEALVRWAREQEGTIAAIGLEAGNLSQWLHRGLTDAGLDAVLMETRQVKGALKAMPIKMDPRDAEGIARLLHLGWFRPVKIQFSLLCLCSVRRAKVRERRQI